MWRSGLDFWSSPVVVMCEKVSVSRLSQYIIGGPKPNG